MLQDAITMEKRYRQFIETVCKTGKVWALKTEEGFATSDSNEYETEEGEALALFCFWSEQASAKACAVEDWNNYVPEEIPLPNFIEHWCVGMSDDETLAGINFDSHMSGHEQEPLQLVLDIAAELKKQHKTLSFEKFQRIEELTEIIEKLMAE